MERVQKVKLRKRASHAGLPRSQAWVFAIIAYWTQFEGGLKIGSGPNWNWREYAEMAEELVVSVRTIARAVQAIKEQGLVETRRIWNPQKSGQNVNAFRLTPAGSTIAELPETAPDD